VSTPTRDDIETLTALANAIVPPDDRDAGAAAVDAGPRLATRLQGDPRHAVYDEGLRIARELAARTAARPIPELPPGELHELMLRLRDAAPGFFKQLRLDVTTMYLSDPRVWERMGFPGPSIDRGGYPDFDQPQGRRD
jgi:hypothetical protein